MDGPPAMALGVDPPRGNVMHRPPRPPGERILRARRLIAITRSGAVMATGTVAVFAVARQLTDAAIAATMAFTTFVLCRLFNILVARSEDDPVLGRHQLHNRTLWISLAAVLTLQVVVVQAPFAQGVFDIVPSAPRSGRSAWPPPPLCSWPTSPGGPAGRGSRARPAGDACSRADQRRCVELPGGRDAQSPSSR